MKLNEVRKEEDAYYQGGFWIVGKSVLEILKGNFEILGHRELSDYEGKYLALNQSVSSLTHKRLWRDDFSRDFVNLTESDYDYFPRGRVAIYKGHAIIHIHHLFNNPKIIDAIIKYYNIGRLEIDIEFNDQTQGSHYDFKLE